MAFVCLRNNGAAIVFSEIITQQKKPRQVVVEGNLACSAGAILSNLFGRPRRAKLSAHRLCARLLRGMHAQMEPFETKMPSLQRRLRLLVFPHQFFFWEFPQTAFTSSETVINGVRSRTRPLPWRQSFGRPGTVGDDVIAERKLRWRASIYEKRLQAVPSSPQNQYHLFLLKLTDVNGDVKFLRQKSTGLCGPWVMDRRAEQENFLISWRHGHGVISFV
ncbi:hypothetical protein FNV43_RR00826 [Rhamnella rubrinervis]|uniref:Uncharacterized protein n=1 Tax=Rhamnella rubrinervis TaxID=2594499 RepID=A0A8K0HPA6_9ROSA|nr:hypothetical protein FNV43_RR00826 [Rhamnella rubrinervis]